MEDKARFGRLWRILIVCGFGFVVFWFGLFQMNIILGPDVSQNIRHFTGGVVISVLTVILVWSARRFMDRRPWAGLQLSRPVIGWRALLLGMAGFYIPAGIALAVCVAAGWTELTLHVPFSELLLVAAVLLVFAFSYEAFPEELIFRGYIYRNLSATSARWVALIVQAILFTLWVSAMRMIGGVSLSVAAGEFVLFFSFAVGLGIFSVVIRDVWAGIGLHLGYITFHQLEGPRWEVVTASHSDIVFLLAYQVVPFVTAVVLLLALYHDRVNWCDHDPDYPQEIEQESKPA